MTYQPQFIVTPALVRRVEQIAALRERILAATVEVPWIGSHRPLHRATAWRRGRVDVAASGLEQRLCVLRDEQDRQTIVLPHGETAGGLS